jgi:hypothetical protein
MLSGALIPINPNVRANTCFVARTSFMRAWLKSSATPSPGNTRQS